MKKLFNLLLSIILGGNIIFNLVACSKKAEDSIINEKVDDLGRPVDPKRAKWYDFHKKIDKIIQDYYSIKNDVSAHLSGNFDILYWKRDRKILEYKSLKVENNELPVIFNNIYENDINKIFTTMKLGIIYKYFQVSYQVISFSEIFYFDREWENNKKYIGLQSRSLSAKLNINWLYKKKEKDLSERNWIETYNENTQIRLFEVIQYYKVTQKLYENEIKKYNNKYYNLKNVFYMRLTDSFRNYINIEKYLKWEAENKVKPGYGVWKEIG